MRRVYNSVPIYQELPQNSSVEEKFEHAKKKKVIGYKKTSLKKYLDVDDRLLLTKTFATSDAKDTFIYETEKEDGIEINETTIYKANITEIINLWNNSSAAQKNYGLYHEFIMGKCRPYFDIEKRATANDYAQLERNIIDKFSKEFATKYPGCKVLWFTSTRFDPYKDTEKDQEEDDKNDEKKKLRQEAIKVKKEQYKAFPYKVSLHAIITGYYYEHPSHIVGYAQKLKMANDNIVDLQVYCNDMTGKANLRMVGCRKGSGTEPLNRFVFKHEVKDELLDVFSGEGAYDLSQCFDAHNSILKTPDNHLDYLIQYPSIDATGLALMQNEPRIAEYSDRPSDNFNTKKSFKIANMKQVDPNVKLNISKDQIEELYMMLPPEQSCDFDKWMLNIFRLKNLSVRMGQDLSDIAHKFSKQYYKQYDPKSVDEMFDRGNIEKRMAAGAKLCGLSSLYELCKASNPEKYKEIIKKYMSKSLMDAIPGSDTINRIDEVCFDKNIHEIDLQTFLRKTMIIIRNVTSKQEYYVYQREKIGEDNDSCVWKPYMCEHGKIPFESKSCHKLIPALAYKSDRKNAVEHVPKLHEIIYNMQQHNMFKSYSKIDFIPYLHEYKHSDEVFNTFKGYAYKPTKNRGINMNLIKNLRWHLANVLCGGGPNAESYALYVEKWISHIIQKPTEKIKCPIWIAFISKEKGTGKNVFFEAIGKFFGDYNIKLSSLAQLTATANHYLVDKLFGIIEEVSNGNSFSAKLTDADKLKSLISSDETLVKQLYKDAFIRKDYSRYICFTNHINGLILSPSERRWAVFDCGSKQSPEYYDRLVADIENKEVMQEYFDYLCSLDLSNWNPVKEAPKTDVRARVIKNTAPPHIKFMYNIASGDPGLWEKIKKYTIKSLRDVELPNKLVINPDRLHEIFKREMNSNWTSITFKETLAYELEIKERKGNDRVMLPNDNGTYTKQYNYCLSLEEIQTRLKKFVEGDIVEIKDEKHEIKDDEPKESDDDKMAYLIEIIKNKFGGNLDNFDKIYNKLKSSSAIPMLR